MTENERQQLLDIEHLRLLRIGYLIAGFTNVAFALFPLIHVSVGLAILLGAFPEEPSADAVPRVLGLMFILMGGAVSLIFAVGATLKLVTARRIRQRQSKTFCMVTAALSCLGVPYGTALGVSTFLILARPSVSALFDTARPPTLTQP